MPQIGENRVAVRKLLTLPFACITNFQLTHSTSLLVSITAISGMTLGRTITPFQLISFFSRMVLNQASTLPQASTSAKVLASRLTSEPDGDSVS